jgi:hypothetical protein
MVPGTPHNPTLKPKLPKIGELGRMLLMVWRPVPLKRCGDTKNQAGGGYRNLPTVSIGIVRIAYERLDVPLYSSITTLLPLIELT